MTGARPGLRERKKARTRAMIAETAMSLFVERGFDRVTVADVARRAEIAVATVFNYFPTKEDLFFDRQDEIVDHLADVIGARRRGESFADACRRDTLALIEAGDWRIGLAPGMREFYRMVDASPALKARSRLLIDRSVDRAAAVIGAALHRAEDDIVVTSAAWILVGLHTGILARVRSDTLGDVPRDALVAALIESTHRAFDLLGGPIAELGES